MVSLQSRDGATAGTVSSCGLMAAVAASQPLCWFREQVRWEVTCVGAIGLSALQGPCLVPVSLK